MSNIVDMKRWKRARLGRAEAEPIHRRARSTTGRKGGSGFVTIGVISSELVRKLMQE